MKRLVYKVYDSDGNYLTDWNDVVSSIDFSNQVNTAGGQLQITLGRSAGDYGEGTDVDFDYIVKVLAYDEDEPDGIIVYQGFISSYTPIYKDDTVQVTLLSSGEQLDRFMIEAGEDEYITQETAGAYAFAFGNWASLSETYCVGQTFTATTSIDLTRIVLKLRSGYSEGNNISCTVQIYEWDTDPATTIAGELLGTGVGIAVNSTMADVSMNFASPIAVTNGTVYFILLTTTDIYTPGSARYAVGCGYNSGGGYAGGQMYYAYNSSTKGDFTWTTAGSSDLYFYLFSSTGDTTAVFNSYDPSDIIKALLDDFNNRGGRVTYDENSIDDTGSTVSYTFSSNTLLEGINKCVELAPDGWYWYIDYETSLLHFHQKATTPDHTFSLEKDLIDAKFEKRIEDIVNKVYFTGGVPSGETDPLYKVYTNSDSIAKYGLRATKYIDQRVTLDSTADAIANNILATKSEPELRVELELVDSNNDIGLGYDIETIKTGDVVAVRNVSQQVGLSTWDVSRWDESYWDFNIYNLSSLQMQIIKLQYLNDRLVIQASTTAVDVSKRIEDINRNLEALQTLNNPDAPS